MAESWADTYHLLSEQIRRTSTPFLRNPLPCIQGRRVSVQDNGTEFLFQLSADKQRKHVKRMELQNSKELSALR